MKNNLAVKVHTGHLVRQLEAIRNGLTVIIDEMKDIPNKYCPICGGELTGMGKEPFVKDGKKLAEHKWCNYCQETYFIPFNHSGDE